MKIGVVGCIDDGAHQETAEATVVVPGRAVRVEAEDVGAVRVRRVLCRRPIVAERAGGIDIVMPSTTRRGQEYGAAIPTSELTAVHTFSCCPCAGAVV